MTSHPNKNGWIRFTRSALHAGAEVLDASGTALSEEIALFARDWVDCLNAGGKLLFFGNGGSQADAQHLSGELVNRYRKNRRGLPALALGSSSPVLTSVANDDSFEQVFAREVEAFGRAGDLAIGLSTSGSSPNVVLALKKAIELGLGTQAFTGKAGGPVARAANRALRVPSEETPLIQQAHLAIGHILCDLVESEIFPEGDS